MILLPGMKITSKVYMDNKRTDILQFELKDGRRILVDFLNPDSLLLHQKDMAEISEQLKKEWPEALKKNIETTSKMMQRF